MYCQKMPFINKFSSAFRRYISNNQVNSLSREGGSVHLNCEKKHTHMKYSLHSTAYRASAILVAILATFAMPFRSQGQAITASTTTTLTRTSSSVLESMTGWVGSATTTGVTSWQLQGAGTTGNGLNGTNQTAGTAGGWYGSNNISFLGSGNSTNGNATLRLVNGTSTTITSFRVVYQATMWKSAANSPTVTYSWSNSASSAIPNTGNLANVVTALGFSDAVTTVAGTAVTLSATIAGASIPANNYIFMRWIHSGGTSSDNLGWDEVNVIPSPTTQASGVNFSSVYGSGVTINWTNGNGRGRAVFMKAGTGTTTATDGTAYTASTTFGSGTQIGTSGYYCVYSGTSTSVSVTGLTSGTQYTAMVMEYNSDGTNAVSYIYLGSPASATVTPANTDYYSKSTGNLDAIGTWVTNPSGVGGTSPSDFATSGQQFHLANGNPGSFSGSTWTISGAGAKLILDASTDLTIGSSITIAGTVDVATGRTLTISNQSLPTLGTIDPASTIIFNGLTFTNTVLLPNSTDNTTLVYGNVIFNNTSVTYTTGTNKDIKVAGNLTLAGTSPFIAGDSTNTSPGYNLVTWGSQAQTISGNGNTFYVRNIDINNTASSKTNTVTLASNTPILSSNSLRMNITGSANRFSDGGNTIKVFNNASMGGDALGYNLTGTLYMVATTSSSNTAIRGYSAGAAGDFVPAPVFNNITVNNGTTKTVTFAPSTGGATITLTGNLNIASTGTGATILGSNTINIGGNFSHSASTSTLTSTGSTVVFNGSGAQTYSSAVTGGNTFNNVKIANGSTLTLSSGMTVGGSLSLSSGVIVTGSNTLTLSSTSTITGGYTGGSASSYINGSLSRALPASATTTLSFPVGDISYSPIRLNFTSGTYTGAFVLVKTTTGKHPSIATSGIDSANFVNRYWTVTPTSFSPTGTVTVDLSYNNPGDMVGATVNTNYFVRRFSASAWTTPTATNSTSGTSPLLSNYTNAGGLASGILAGDYVVGNRLCSSATGGTVSASAPLVCSPGTTTLSLSGASTGAGITYQWLSSNNNFTTTTTISGATSSTYTDPSITANTAYKCIVGCTFTGTVVSTSATVTVSTGVPTITSVNASPNPICSGATLSLTSSGVAGATSYSWAGPGSFSVATSTTTRAAITTAGAGTYTFTATNACGSTTLSPTDVVVNTTPTSLSITASPAGSVCSGNSFSLTPSSTSFAAPTYAWRGPGLSSTTADLLPPLQ